MSNAWDAIRAAIEEERAGHIYEGKRTGDRMSEADRKRLGTCVAGCGHDDGEERRELRRAVEEEMLPARDLVERQDSPEESFMASIRSSIFAAATTAGTATGDTTTDNLSSATTRAPDVETTIDAEGNVVTTTLDVPSGTQAVVTPTLASTSAPFNTKAGEVTSTAGLAKPTATDSSSTSSSQQDTSAQQGHDSSGGLTQSAKIGLGVGVGVGVPLLLALIALLFLRRRKRQSHKRMSPKYETRGQSDLSMIETPHPGAMSASREPLHPDHGEVSKQFHSQQYQAYHPPPPPPPPIDTFGDEDVFQTPISAITRSELRTPISDGRPMSRHIPGGPPVLTIPEPNATPLQSRDASIDGGVSPVSPVSSVSAVSRVGSRAPSPKQQQWWACQDYDQM
ncbi:hypothetical protein CLAFUW4_11167 [Fulvia fulva]|uniref:Uncharacterized protein n=1 Tax=Passalora fulva TaxID=5499 RepID=A0A9Q8PD85_PASFU|nr:uncharacterized protein CLAFUR5_10211 [Fulvia fulva]KAK4619910.1 hypothetical protein CLAFUR4_11172 [Fulvia fulva]KAK4620424.1 hypothetical protein CLAFUR0_11177 [Fulvia fulva]UJO20414.1 hypothetical protein CLAFUR5_10211 [Fulvia fulva]WPV17320.1 hypothetical protein CLAFUW4_11167 [Fulvia fulva]WPV31817.1 hypothetical protein CLAFUW7_11163 [Fulvia fulva]